MKHASHVFAKGVLVSLVGVFLVGVINYGTRLLLAHTLEPEDYGYFYAVSALALLVITLAGGGLGYSVIVLVSRYRATGNHERAVSILGHVLLVTASVSLVIAGILLLFTRPLLHGYFRFPQGGRSFALVCLSIPLAVSLSVVLAALNAMRDFVARNIIYASQYALLLIVAWVGVHRIGVSAPALGLAVSNGVLLAIALPYAARRHGLLGLAGCFSADIVTETWRFARWMILSSTGMLLLASVDTLMLTWQRGLEAVAVYNIALPIVQIFHMAMVVPIVFSPIATDLWHRGRKDEIASIGRFVVTVMLGYVWLLVLLLFPSATVLISILFGKAFTEAAGPLMVLGIGVPVLLTGQFFMNTLSAIDQPMKAGLAATGTVGVNIVLNVVLIRLYGVVGAAGATVVGYVFLMLISALCLDRYVHIPVLHRDNLWVCVLGGLSVGVVRLLSIWQPALHPLYLSAIGMALFGALCAWTLRRSWQGALRLLKPATTSDGE